MSIHFDRKTFFDAVRDPLFDGRLSQQQVDGLNFKLDVWEQKHPDVDLRFLAYCLATSKHETASTMWPVEEYGKGAGSTYGKVVPETGWAYYGRGDVQLTWDYNYKGATQRLSLTGDNDLYWHADKALDPKISADVMYRGMMEGWFRSPNALGNYFSASKDDPYNARDIVNGDKKIVPSWSKGVSIGNLIAGYYSDFLPALKAASSVSPPTPKPEAVSIVIDVPIGTKIVVNGNEVIAA